MEKKTSIDFKLALERTLDNLGLENKTPKERLQEIEKEIQDKESKLLSLYRGIVKAAGFELIRDDSYEYPCPDWTDHNMADNNEEVTSILLTIDYYENEVGELKYQRDKINELKEYVGVSQGIEIFRTFNIIEAKNRTYRGNSYADYNNEELLIAGYPTVDNYIELYEEPIGDKEKTKRLI